MATHRATEMPQGIGLQPVKRELEIFAAESCWPMVRYTDDKTGNRCTRALGAA